MKPRAETFSCTNDDLHIRWWAGWRWGLVPGIGIGAGISLLGLFLVDCVFKIFRRPRQRHVDEEAGSASPIPGGAVDHPLNIANGHDEVAVAMHHGEPQELAAPCTPTQRNENQIEIENGNDNENENAENSQNDPRNADEPTKTPAASNTAKQYPFQDVPNSLEHHKRRKTRAKIEKQKQAEKLEKEGEELLKDLGKNSKDAEKKGNKRGYAGAGGEMISVEETGEGKGSQEVKGPEVGGQEINGHERGGYVESGQDKNSQEELGGAEDVREINGGQKDGARENISQGNSQENVVHEESEVGGASTDEANLEAVDAIIDIKKLFDDAE